MKRKREWPDGNMPPRKIRKAFSRAQLAEVGAVVLAWNHLEVMLDMVLGEAMQLPDFYRHEVIGRIHGIDGKIALIRIAATDVCLAFDDPVLKLIEKTLAGAGECKSLRDSIAHARTTLFTPKDLAQTTGARGQSFDLLFSAKILSQVVKRIDAVADELGTVHMLYVFQAAVMDNLLAPRPDRERFGRDVQLLQRDMKVYEAQLLRDQKKRLSLPPLPAFPKERPDQLGLGSTPEAQA